MKRRRRLPLGLDVEWRSLLPKTIRKLACGRHGAMVAIEAGFMSEREREG
jgi:hypothetical protein